MTGGGPIGGETEHRTDVQGSSHEGVSTTESGNVGRYDVKGCDGGHGEDGGGRKGGGDGGGTSGGGARKGGGKSGGGGGGGSTSRGGGGGGGI